VADFDRIRTLYRERLRLLADELATEADAGPLEREHILLLNRMFTALLDVYGTHAAGQGPALDVNTSVMYAAAQQSEPQVLNVPLRSLVEYNTISMWQARLLNSLMSGRRTLLLTGQTRSGKSTLLNSLLHLLPGDMQMVAIEEQPELPALRNRAFTLTLAAKPGSAAMGGVLKRATAAMPTCLVAGKLTTADVPTFLGAIPSAAFGLATLDTPDPEVGLADWLAVSKEAPALLGKIMPILVHMERDQAGRPRLNRVLEARPRADTVELVEIQQRG
jgi:Flp pilus assembly CpaF family ATPase